MNIQHETKRLRAALLQLGLGMSLAACADVAVEAEEMDESEAALHIFFGGEVVTDWNEHALATLTAHDGYADPLEGSRVLAMVHVAMHDAVDATRIGRAQRYALRGRDPLAHPVAAAATAAERVLEALYPAQTDALRAALDSSLASVPDGVFERRGVRLGERAAAATLARRAEDAAIEPLPYTPGSAPGDYQPTTPGLVFRPEFQLLTPFALARADQFLPPPPPSLDSARYAEDFAELLAKGRLDGSTRSDDESRYAQFWYEFSELGWNRVTRVVSAQEHLGLASAARLFALVNVALVDSYIAGWDAKFHYDFWRPLTAIHAAASDGNASTEPDASYTSFLPTPPVQDYPSTHSMLGAAAAEVLTRFFGGGCRVPGFAMRSPTARDPELETRSFASFYEAAEENADSRVMAGIHFRFSCEAGLSAGAQIGAYVFEHALCDR